MSDINNKGDEPYRRDLQVGKAEIIQPKDNRHRQMLRHDPISNDSRIAELEKRIEQLERTVAGLQILLGKASEYKARPRRERLP